ncbi:MAG TPA: invasion associated locus B family protein [Hyphomicrobium sp.]|jgi:invasion protein IalB|uniref:invasion associated locus B family protein n=1 Tax=Hyphomicrobium sp. TaxID=82 RepID=UPI002C34BB09|nr:invasion associated locus B family protein [Hyphomicrobium sp.]HXE01531.1 invasion associated locus B family protein [Hyphomicrobium sp.]
MGYAALRASGRALASALALAVAMSVSAASAQDAPEKEIKITPKKVESTPAPAKAAKPAAGAPAATANAATGAGKSAWVKLCEKAPLVKKDKDGKEVKEEKELCLTHHERLDGNTGMVLVSAAIREIKGQPKKSLMIMVPLGMAIPPGIRAAVYTKEQWAAAAKNEKIDEKTLKPIELKYSLCHPAGCTAETEATPEILAEMAKGGGLMVLAMNAAAQPVGFPVPLDGYNEATAGPPVDNKKYAEARSSLMKQIRERQQKMAEQWKEKELKNLPLDAPGAPPTTTGSTGAKAAPKK